MKLDLMPPNLSTLPFVAFSDTPKGDKDSQEDLSPLSSSSCEEQEKKQTKSGEWGVFASTFVTILLAEIGDKTQLTTLLMTAESHAPWIVFAGAGTALVTTSLLGVLLGKWLAKRLSPQTIETAAGISLLLISATLLWDILR